VGLEGMSSCTLPSDEAIGNGKPFSKLSGPSHKMGAGECGQFWSN
jgi:hypothetical protein